MKKATDSFFSQTKEIADIINANTSKIKEAWNGFFFK